MITAVGIKRLKYSMQIEKAPSRFADNKSYELWAMRADAWNGEVDEWTK